jgi:hypothetical protein
MHANTRDIPNATAIWALAAIAKPRTRRKIRIRTAALFQLLQGKKGAIGHGRRKGDICDPGRTAAPAPPNTE